MYDKTHYNKKINKNKKKEKECDDKEKMLCSKMNKRRVFIHNIGFLFI